MALSTSDFSSRRYFVSNSLDFPSRHCLVRLVPAGEQILRHLADARLVGRKAHGASLRCLRRRGSRWSHIRVIRQKLGDTGEIRDGFIEIGGETLAQELDLPHAGTEDEVEIADPFSHGLELCLRLGQRLAPAPHHGLRIFLAAAQGRQPDLEKLRLGILQALGAAADLGFPIRLAVRLRARPVNE